MSLPATSLMEVMEIRRGVADDRRMLRGGLAGTVVYALGHGKRVAP